MKLAAAVCAAAIAASAAVAHAEPSAVIVLSADATPVDAATTDAILRGVRAVAPSVTAGSASLADTAFMAGCDPAEAACLEAVRAQLGVRQLVIVTSRKDGDQTIVEVTATHRGAPTRRSFTIGADPGPSLAEVEAAMPVLLGTESASEAPPPVSGGGSVADTPRRAPRAALGLAIGGGTLAGFGLLMWAMAGSTQSKIDDAPTATPADLDHLAELESTGRTYASLGNGLVIAGTIAAGAGLGWLYWDRRQRRARSLRFTPVAGPEVAGISLEGTW